MFQQLQAAAPDAILGLNEAFANDTTDGKINLTTGVYKDASGTTPVLACVKEAERRLVETEATKGYLGIDGMKEFGDAARGLLFGADHEITTSGRTATIQAPGGTGALRVAAEFLATAFPEARIWCSRPTWANHPNIFRATGLEVNTYDYLDKDSLSLSFDALTDSLAKIPAGDVVCLHACCHNPTGVDPSPEQWDAIAEICQHNQLLPLIDFAYQGFGDGLSEDSVAIQQFIRRGSEMLVASSFSKNFGLYCERIGALTIVAADGQAAQAALSHAKLSVRTNYSNPPKHGGAIVAAVLSDPQLRASWETDVAAMRERIQKMRARFVAAMTARTSDHDFSFIQDQRGMFSYSGLNRQQVDRLRTEFSVYAVGSGRINVAGMTENNIEPLCDAIAAVL